MAIDVNGAGLAELSGLLRVLADENRLRIMKLLTQQERCVCDIMAELDLTQPLASHHLGVLKRAGLVRDRQDAQWVYYSIDPEGLAALNSQYLELLDVTNLAPEAAYGAGRHLC
jgi:ArsR family transcriptional regulator